MAKTVYEGEICVAEIHLQLKRVAAKSKYQKF